MPPKRLLRPRTSSRRRRPGSSRRCRRAWPAVAASPSAGDRGDDAGDRASSWVPRPFEEHRAQHVGPLEQLGGRAVEPDLALLHEVRGLGDGERDVHRLLDEDDRRARRLELPHDLEQLADDARREPERQLVDHEQARLLDERHAERQHLLLAAGEVAAGLVEPVARAPGRSRAPCSVGLADVVLVLAVQPPRELQVLARRSATGRRPGRRAPW